LLKPNNVELSKAYDKVAEALVYLKKSDIALDYRLKALEVANNSQKDNQIILELIRTGEDYGDMGDHHKSYEYANKAIEKIHKGKGFDDPLIVEAMLLLSSAEMGMKYY